MFEFFLALFGGAYYGTKMKSDKASAKAYDKASKERSDGHEARLCDWESKVVDRSLEDALRNFILLSVSSDEQRKTVWEAVHSAYMQMPSRKNEAYISSPEMMKVSNFHIFGFSGPITFEQLSKKQQQTATSNWLNETLDIMLAQNGKVRYEVISHHINSFLVGLGPGQDDYSKEEWNKKFDFWVYIQEELRRHGVNTRLIFRTGYAGTNGPGIAYDVSDVEAFRYQYGQLTWLPLTYFDDDLQYISV